MRTHKIRMATLLVLAVGGLTSANCGIAVGDDPGAAATGGSSTAGANVFQQDTAQESKQNNNCSNENFDVTQQLTDSRRDVRCVTDDASFNKHDLVEDGGARAEGGSSTGGGVIQQNTAQSGRQNNNCANPNFSSVSASGGGRQESGCVDKDASHAKHSVVKGGDARAEGGSTPVNTVGQQNTAQSGRQNNNCANPNSSNVPASGGGRQESGCVNKDASHAKHSVVKGGDARAEGGSSTVTHVFQQNTAQSGRQNNNCANPNNSTVSASGGGRQESGCVNKDASHAKHSVVKGGDARAEGGSAAGSTVYQQNTAQSGRQNNNCANPNRSAAESGGRQESGCVNKDASHAKHSVVKGGDARAEGGSAAGTVIQQNTAQTGRQNNNCANPNTSSVFANGGGRQKSECVNKDASHAKHSVIKGGDARAEGGSSTGGNVFQQNTAQTGRQNNNCANPNESTIGVTDSDAEIRCLTVDESTNKGTVEIGDGAEAESGRSALDLSQQNTAQSGRQNNNCGNPNHVTLTPTGSRHQVQCTAVDRSTNIGSVHR
ncbi:hypothetical protein OG604_49185 [Streptomyces sp. NBC_01231]|nr:hypothetical protein OG604_49185 [Streptomyces sp. NBC_01231]